MNLRRGDSNDLLWSFVALAKSPVICLALICFIAIVTPYVSATPAYQQRVIVLSQGPTGDWDQAGVMQPSVVFSGGLYRMWYTGTDGLTTGIGYAVSSDGRQWNRVQNRPVTIEGPGWSGPTLHPTVLAMPTGGYQMWFSSDLAGGEIGLATSLDGRTWTGASSVLQPGSPGSWDEGGVGEPAVIKDSSGYWMWYIGIDSYGGNASIGLATSTDGANWTKSLSNPVLTSISGTFFSDSLSSPSAARLNDGTYVLWFSGSDGLTSRIGRMTSPDGVSWSSPEMILDVGESATADGVQVRDPTLLGTEGEAVWYSGFDGVTWRILLAIPAPPPPATPLVTTTSAAVAFTAGIGIVGAAVFATSDRFKYALLAIPLAFRTVKDKNLDKFVRGQIYQYIRQNPGDYYSSIMAATGATNGNLAYHLRVLEKQGFIKSVKQGRLVRFYPKDTPIPKGDGIRFSSLQVRMLEEISRAPGISQSELARILGLRRQTIAYNVWSLVDNGVVEIRKVGRETYAYTAKEDNGGEVAE